MNEFLNPFFIALIPSPEIREEIILFKKDLFERFGSKAALKVVPHITLKAPFKLPETEHNRLRYWFRKLSIIQKSFTIEVKDFGSFPKPHSPVLYINVIKNKALSSLQKELLDNLYQAFPLEISQQETEFHPHITIAYRDLKPENFEVAWKEYSMKQYQAVFVVQELSLLQHNGKNWEVLETKSLDKEQ